MGRKESRRRTDQGSEKEEKDTKKPAAHTIVVRDSAYMGAIPTADRRRDLDMPKLKKTTCSIGPRNWDLISYA